VRLFLIVVMLLTYQPARPTRIRLLLRDETDSGVAGATLTLRTAAGQTIQLATDANGVVVSGALAGQAVWLTGGRLASGQVLIADSYPPKDGFRLALIPNQTRDALLRLDGDRIVLDPDMIFSPGEPGEPLPPTPPALAAMVPPLNAAAAAATADPIPATVPALAAAPAVSPAAQTDSATLPVLWWVIGIGIALMALALLVGLARRRTM
jgi:hypothetical protein